MKIVVLGAGGQLASDVATRLVGHQVTALSRTELDVRDAERAKTVFGELKPDVVVNTAAYNLVDKAEVEPAEAFNNNALGPMALARACGAIDVKLIHVSTDYVFGSDASRLAPWVETDAPGPVSVYGLSKLAGEHMVRTYCPRHFILRTCGLYGVKGSRGKGGNFVETMLRLGSANGTVKVVADQFCTPTSTRDLASAIAAVVGNESHGLYHVTNTGSTSWHGFAAEIFAQAGMKVDCVPITSAQFNAPARRPPYSVLSTTNFSRLLGRPLPTWQQALAQYLKDRANK